MLSRKGTTRRTLLLGLVLLLVGAVGCVFFEDIRHGYQAIQLRNAFRQRDWKSALAMLDAHPQQGNKAAEWNYLRAKAARRSGDHQAAAQALKAASESGWNRDDIAREQILLNAQSGNIADVEKDLQQLRLAGATDEQAEEIYEASARGLMMSLRFADAFQCLKFWAEWQSDNPLPHLWLGELHQRLEDPQLAANSFAEVLKRDPRHLEGKLKLGGVRLSQLEIEKAEVLFKECVEQDPDSGPAILG
jgi:tetratricopeptide (TPR) repeat protein